MTCVPSEDSDQPGHLPSLIRVLAVHMKKAWVLSYPLSAQRRLIRLGGCPGWSESSLGAVILLVLSWGGSNISCNKSDPPWISSDSLLTYSYLGLCDRFGGSEQPSGYGFELTLRLKKKENEATPPMWPARIMNQLANYVFQTGLSKFTSFPQWNR